MAVDDWRISIFAVFASDWRIRWSRAILDAVV